jgi:hypothetical protein
MTDRLNPKSILVCNLALRECGKEVENNPISLMNHFIEHGWKKIPEHVQKEIDQHKPYPRYPHKVLTESDYLKLLEEHPEYWWFDNEFHWVDIRNLHFLHKTSKRLRSLRMYYHG